MQYSYSFVTSSSSPVATLANSSGINSMSSSSLRSRKTCSGGLGIALPALRIVCSSRIALSAVGQSGPASPPLSGSQLGLERAAPAFLLSWRRYLVAAALPSGPYAWRRVWAKLASARRNLLSRSMATTVRANRYRRGVPVECVRSWASHLGTEVSTIQQELYYGDGHIVPRPKPLLRPFR